MNWKANGSNRDFPCYIWLLYVFYKLSIVAYTEIHRPMSIGRNSW